MAARGQAQAGQQAPRGGYRLFKLYFPDCPTCAAVKEPIDAWVKAHSAVRLVDMDLMVHKWRAERWEPKKVPTLILLTPEGKNHVYTFKDGMDPDEWVRGIDRWISKVAPAAAEEDAEVVDG